MTLPRLQIRALLISASPLVRLFVVVTLAGSCGCDDGTDPEASSRAVEPASDRATSVVEEEGASSTTREPVVIKIDSDAEGEYVSFPAAGVRLIRPDGFDDAESFHGFQQPSAGASVMVVKVPGSFSEVADGFTAIQLMRRGMIFRGKESVEIDGESGVLLDVSQTAGGTRFLKWMLAFGDDEVTRLVTATFPASEESRLSEPMRTVVLSARADDTPPPEPGSDVGFSIVASEKLKLTSGIGKILMYTKSGAIPVESEEDALFIAAPSFSEVPIEDPRELAIARLHQTALVKVGSVDSVAAIEIDGLDGYELLAETRHSESDAPLTLYQVILFDGGSYILMQGRVGAELREEYLPEFKAMARSLTRSDG